MRKSTGSSKVMRTIALALATIVTLTSVPVTVNGDEPTPIDTEGGLIVVDSTGMGSSSDSNDESGEVIEVSEEVQAVLDAAKDTSDAEGPAETNGTVDQTVQKVDEDVDQLLNDKLVREGGYTDTVNASLQQNIADADEAIDDAAEEASNIAGAETAMQTNLQTAAEKADDAEDAAEAFDGEVNKAAKDISDLNQQILNAETPEQAQNLYSQASSIKTATDKNLETTQKNFNQISQDFMQAVNDYVQAQTDYEDAVDNASDDLDVASQKLAAAKQNVEDLKNKAKAAEVQAWIDYKNTVDAANGKINAARTSRNIAQGEFNSAVGDLNLANRRLKKANKDLEDANKKVEDAEAALKNAVEGEGGLNEKQKALDEAKKYAADAKKNVEDKQKEVNAKQKEKDNLEKSLGRANDQLTSALEDQKIANAAVEIGEAVLESAKAEVASATAEKQEAQNKVNGLKSEISGLNTTISGLKDDIDDLEIEIRELEDSIPKLEAAVNGAKVIIKVDGKDVEVKPEEAEAKLDEVKNKLGSNKAGEESCKYLELKQKKDELGSDEEGNESHAYKKLADAKAALKEAEVNLKDKIDNEENAQQTLAEKEAALEKAKVVNSVYEVELTTFSDNSNDTELAKNLIMYKLYEQNKVEIEFDENGKATAKGLTFEVNDDGEITAYLNGEKVDTFAIGYDTQGNGDKEKWLVVNSVKENEIKEHVHKDTKYYTYFADDGYEKRETYFVNNYQYVLVPARVPVHNVYVDAVAVYKKNGHGNSYGNWTFVNYYFVHVADQAFDVTTGTEKKYNEYIKESDFNAIGSNLDLEGATNDRNAARDAIYQTYTDENNNVTWIDYYNSLIGNDADTGTVSLKGRVNSAQAKVNDLGVQISALEGEITALEILVGKLETLDGAYDALSEAKESLREKRETLGVDENGNKTGTGLYNDLAVAEGQLSDKKTALGNNGWVKKGAYKELADAKTRLGLANAAVNGAQWTLDYILKPAQSRANKAVNDAQTKVNNRTGALSTAKSELEQLQGELGRLKGIQKEKDAAVDAARAARNAAGWNKWWKEQALNKAKSDARAAKRDVNSAQAKVNTKWREVRDKGIALKKAQDNLESVKKTQNGVIDQARKDYWKKYTEFKALEDDARAAKKAIKSAQAEVVTFQNALAALLGNPDIEDISELEEEDIPEALREIWQQYKDAEALFEAAKKKAKDLEVALKNAEDNLNVVIAKLTDTDDEGDDDDDDDYSPEESGSGAGYYAGTGATIASAGTIPVIPLPATAAGVAGARTGRRASRNGVAGVRVDNGEGDGDANGEGDASKNVVEPKAVASTNGKDKNAAEADKNLVKLEKNQVPLADKPFEEGTNMNLLWLLAAAIAAGAGVYAYDKHRKKVAAADEVKKYKKN